MGARTSLGTIRSQQQQTLRRIKASRRRSTVSALEQIRHKTIRFRILARRLAESFENSNRHYLLSDSETGEARYVGQADGIGGFFARWTEYARNGHGGNLAMQALEKSDYIVRILAIGS